MDGWLHIWESSLPGVLQPWLGRPRPTEQHWSTGSQAGLSCVQVAHPVSSCPASCGGVIGAVCSVSLPFPFPSPSPTPQNDASIQTVHPGHQKPLSVLWSPPRIHSGPAKDSKASDSSHPVSPAPMTLNSPADHTGSDVAREPLRQP